METVKYQTLFSELTNYEKKGVSLSIEGIHASPLQIVNAHLLRENVAYMRDYVLDDKGDIMEVCFDQVKPVEVNTPQNNNKMSK